MSVVNVKVKHIRPEYDNLKEWCEDSNNVYIGRRGIVFVNGERYPKEDSLWHNLFKIKDNYTREMCIADYQEYIIKKVKDENLGNELLNLRNKTLGCWCKPEDCHGDILIMLIDNYDEYFN